METILIQSDAETSKILTELAKKLGSSVLKLNEEQLKDFALGNLMKAVRTGEKVSKETILQKLRNDESKQESHT